ncbi:hypothetical protein SR882_07725 [Guyparkeria halophila]|uniref:Zinc resistance-associated protein n=1 Tax=Guyparkeria halophila TaxID=47960 RepID=A0ABZ0YUH0_9GAMM|nr:hypothetical protein [Guyparkeria halophila]WQH15651.1 hypothetical protein SR882_07725 [Guyparkeria halophila]
MIRKRLLRELTACGLAATMLTAAPAVLADDDKPRRGMYGPGMMDGSGPYGPGYGQGYGQGYGPGYGMQGGAPCTPGAGYGQGMMGPGMMGPGMMGPGYGGGYGGGYGHGMMQPGYGPGMMGPGYGAGYGPGMMGPGYGQGMMGSGGYGPMMNGSGPGWGGQPLSEKQRERMRELQQEEQKAHWERMQKMQDRQRELQRLQLAEEPDYDAIKEKSREIGELQQQMAEERIEMHKRMREALDQN